MEPDEIEEALAHLEEVAEAHSCAIYGEALPEMDDNETVADRINRITEHLKGLL